jgi:4-amino-4-deoxy-L-arabinose transferase-like glycosyltransferase
VLHSPTQPSVAYHREIAGVAEDRIPGLPALRRSLKAETVRGSENASFTREHEKPLRSIVARCMGELGQVIHLCQSSETNQAQLERGGPASSLTELRHIIGRYPHQVLSLPVLEWPMRLNRSLTVVVLVAAALRVVAAMAIGNRFQFADEAIYVDAAHRLLHGGGFGVGYQQAPGYPVFLAVLAAPLPATILALRLGQGVLAGLGSALVYALAAPLAGSRPALIAAAIYALDPLLVVSAGLLYPETAAALLLAIAILAAWRASRDSLGNSSLAGVLLGAVTLLRPVALVLVPVAAAWIAFAVDVSPRRAAAHLGLVLTGALLVLAPWTYRNYRVRGQLAPIAVAGTHTAPVTREDLAKDGLTVSMVKKAWTDPAAFAARTARQFVQFWELAPTRLKTDDPALRAALHQKDPRLPTGALVPPGLRDLVSTLLSAVEFGLALVGLIILWRMRSREALLISLVTIAFALGYALFVAKLRYRIPVLPLVFVLAGVGAWKLATALAAVFTGTARTEEEASEPG